MRSETNDRQPADPAPREPSLLRRPWSTPTIDVVEAVDTDGPTNHFPNTDSLTGIS